MEPNVCNICNKTFSRISNLNKHLRENKVCSRVNNVQTDKKECMWCKGKYDNIKIHLKNCKADKDTIHQQIIKEKDLEISFLKEQIEVYKKKVDNLDEKLYNLANKSTTTNTINTTTYNTILNCDKPLILTKEYVQKQLIDYCGITYLKRGGNGICDWFLEYVCVNEYGNLCIECVDKNRNRFKFEDINEKINEISGKDIVELIRSCFPSFKKTIHYLSFLQEIEEYCKMNYPLEEQSYKQYEYIYAVDNMYNEFVNRLVSRTHKDSFKSLLKTNKDKEEIT